MDAVFCPHNLKQRQNFSRLCRKQQCITYMYDTALFGCCFQKQGFCTFPHQILLSSKEVMNNILPILSEYRYKNNQNKSCDSLPWTSNKQPVFVSFHILLMQIGQADQTT